MTEQAPARSGLRTFSGACFSCSLPHQLEMAAALVLVLEYWRVTEKTVASRLPAALAYKLIRRGCSPADLATLAMLRPRGGHVPQQTKAGRAIKPGQGASNLAPPLQPLPGASPPTGGDQAAQQETAC
eukprot:COSAG06_NODE_1751_length_8472_cov_19.492774_6_plen_128_part_00